MYDVTFRDRLGNELFSWRGPIPRIGELIYRPEVKYRVSSVTYWPQHDEFIGGLDVSISVYLSDESP